MAWQNPIYSYVHALRDAIDFGGGSVGTDSGGAAWANPARLYDNRAGSVAATQVTSADAFVSVNRGTAANYTGGVFPEIDRIIIPAGHNLTGNIQVETSSDNAAWLDLLTATSIPAGGARIDLEQNAGSAATRSYQYVKLTIADAGTVWEIPEVVFTRVEETIRGPEQGWTDVKVDNVIEENFRSGIVAAAQQGPQRRRISHAYRRLEGVDITLFEELFATGIQNPFWFTPAYDTSTPLWVRFTDTPQMTEDTPSPKRDDTAKRIAFTVLENIA